MAAGRGQSLYSGSVAHAGFQRRRGGCGRIGRGRSMTRNATRWSAAVLAVAVSGLLLAADPITPATVAKPSIDVHAKPDFASPTVAKFSKNAPVKVTGQQGLWFQLALDGGKTGYVRVN